MRKINRERYESWVRWNYKMSILLFLGGFIIAVLAAIALYYQWLVYKKNKTDIAAEQALAEQLKQRQERNLKSIVVLSRALLADQVSSTEASIRINALAQTLTLEPDAKEILSVFVQLSEATAHIPILEQWKKLPTKKKRAFDAERQKIEAGFQDFVEVAAKKVVDGALLSYSIK